MPNTKPLNLSGMANVAPFEGTTGASIETLSDLTTGLPFTSQSSTIPPQNSASTPKQNFQKPGEPEMPPVPKGRITQTTFKDYVSSMGVYLEEFYKYEGALLSYLNERHESDAPFGNAQSASKLIDTFGEDSRGTGVEALSRKLAEDDAVVEALSGAKKRRRHVLDEYNTVKKRIKATGVATE